MLHSTIVQTLGLLVIIIILATIAPRIHVPYAVLLVIGGAILGSLPFLPHIVLEPDLVLLLFLPPLVFSSAWFTSWRDFRREFPAIFLLAIGLVLVTMLAVALVAHLVIPGLSWASAFLLGAIVSPTDTVAASTVLQNFGLSRRVTTIIEGESLVNDATGLVAYHFALAAAVTGTFSLPKASLQFFVSSIGGIVLGLALAIPVSWLHKLLHYPPSEILLTVLTSFAGYLLADSFGMSGVLATVAAGLYLGRQSANFFASDTRLQANSFWNVLVFLFNGLIFLLLGLQLNMVIVHSAQLSFIALLGYAALISLTVIGVRILWSFTSMAILRFLHSYFHLRYQVSDWRYTCVISWAGMRGGVSLAAALAVPSVTASGQAFPAQSLIIFLTFGVILSTLVIQSLTLGPLIRLLGLEEDHSLGKEMSIALQAVTDAVGHCLEELQQQDWAPQGFISLLSAFFKRRKNLLAHLAATERDTVKERIQARQRVQNELRQVERRTLIDLRNSDQISDEVFHRIERELDLRESSRIF
ncbi:Na+/H+ antiporter [Ktedonosporobacter rubrisoli]|uniref:Na+/H+ antiporter n=1 Tax=Ktedonosporobacter rubrisoli TaxID=2509675 RepID=A0A4P6JM06_KTERU|nr:Na+/H+ antiporter [Ktedonosporobacter rubrisoli]QBD76070.1 Na+/H+ antiporter [Ktedonosporobacter rubrisoli]